MKPRERSAATPSQCLCFVQASGQNAFFGELLDALRHAAGRRGLATETSIDHFPPHRPGLVYLFVPHEYLPFTLPAAHPVARQLERTIVLSSEQPGSGWFEQAAAVARSAGTTLDINSLGVQELRRRGISARRIQLGYIPEWDLWKGEEAVERATDVAFLGGHTPRRADALARCGPVLTGHRSELRIIENDRPKSPASPGFLAGPAKWRRLASTKVLLNVHRDANGYLEWQRALEAIINGCVLVTEHSRKFEPLEPGVHFVSTSVCSLPDVVDVLLQSDDFLFSMRNAAYQFIRDDLHIDGTIEPLLDSVEQLSQLRSRRNNDSQPGRPLPKTVEPAPPEWTQLSHPRDNEYAAKVVSTGDVRVPGHRKVRFQEQESPHKTGHFEMHRGSHPRIEVIVVTSVAGVEETVRSVALSDAVELDLVLAAARGPHLESAASTLARYPWIHSTLIELPPNVLLGTARNMAMARSSAEFILMLTPRDTVFRQAFDRLASKLDSDRDVAFAYGIFESVDHGGRSELTSWLEWNPARLVRSDFIGSAALIRRSALMEVGGYTEDPRLEGWEHHDLLCAFADHGLRGALVPEIIGRHAQPRSADAGGHPDPAIPWNALLERHPFLQEAYSGAPRR